MDIRRTAKQVAAIGLDWSGARHLIAARRRIRAGGRRVLVFGYHRVCSDFEAERARSIETCLISRATFTQHVAFLSRHFELVTMSRALEVLAGRERAPRDVAAITFDDGYRDVLENAAPVLRAAGAPATLYVSSAVVARAGQFPHDRLYTLLQRWQQSQSLFRQTAPTALLDRLAPITALPGGPRIWLHELIDRLPPAELEHLIADLTDSDPVQARPPATAEALDWTGVRSLSADGWEIGAHTTGHFVLTHLDRPAIEAELRACRSAIEKAIRRPVEHFAYCNGYYNDTVIDALRRCGFVSAVTTEDRLNRIGDDPFRIARRVVWEGTARGSAGTSASLLACQLDDTWSAFGFNASEPGFRSEPQGGVSSERRLA
jgi:peptidoglycan/xylan/chitin deacetylase (PgdA/CDA1 family)